MRMTVPRLRVLYEFLSAPEQEHYGFELCRSTGLASGTLYPILTDFRQAKWIKDAWEDIDEKVEGRRKRRHYRLTPKGRAEGLAAYQEHQRPLIDGLQLERAEGL